MAEESSEELIDSMVRVTWDPSGSAKVLVAIGDPMWKEVLVDGKQIVDVAQGLNRQGVANYPRGNETHKLTFTLARITDGPEDAFEQRLDQAIAVPRDMADVLISLASGKSWRLKNCATESWPSDQVGCLTKESLVIFGGELVAESGSVTPGGNEAEVALFSNLGIQSETLAPLSTWLNTGTGSMNAMQPAAANQPVAIAPSLHSSGAILGGLYLPGIAGNYGSTPDAGILDISGDLCLSWHGKLDDYTPGAKCCLISKWATAGDQRSYAFFINPDGTLELQISTDGTAAGVLTYTSTVPTGLSPRTFASLTAVRAGSTIRFWVAPFAFPDGGGTFSTIATQLGAAVAGVSTAIFNSTAPLNIGATDGGTQHLVKGWTMQAITRKTHNNGVGSGATDYRLLFYQIATGATSVPEFYGAADLTVNRTGDIPAKIVAGFRGQFDGSNDRMDLSSPLQLSSIGGLTLAWYGALNRVTGDNDLIFCGTNAGTQPRALLRVDDGDLKVLVRRTDSEATATVTFAGAIVQYDYKTLAASIDYAAGTAALYVNGVLVASGALTSAGTTDATFSNVTRIMAGVGGANAAAGDVARVVLQQRALNIFEMAALHLSLTTNSG